MTSHTTAPLQTVRRTATAVRQRVGGSTHTDGDERVSQRLRTVFARTAVREKAIAVAVTTAIIIALVLVSSSAGAVVTTLTGDEEVEQGDTITLEATVEIEEDERIPLEGYLLTITDQEGDSLEQVFTADGEPTDAMTDSEKIDIDALDPTLETIDHAAEFGYGELVGYDHAIGYEFEPGYEHPIGYEELVGYEHDHAVGDELEFGYGYGYGYAADQVNEITVQITLNAGAFDVNEYDAQVEVVTEDVGEMDTDDDVTDADDDTMNADDDATDADDDPATDTWPSDDLETAFASNIHTFEVVEADVEEPPEEEPVDEPPEDEPVEEPPEEEEPDVEPPEEPDVEPPEERLPVDVFVLENVSMTVTIEDIDREDPHGDDEVPEEDPDDPVDEAEPTDPVDDESVDDEEPTDPVDEKEPTDCVDEPTVDVHTLEDVSITTTVDDATVEHDETDDTTESAP